MFSADLIPGTQGDTDTEIYKSDPNVTLTNQLRQEKPFTAEEPDTLDVQRDTTAAPNEHTAPQENRSSFALTQQPVADTSDSQYTNTASQSDPSAGETKSDSGQVLQPEFDHSDQLVAADATTQRNELVFIDTSTPDSAQLLEVIQSQNTDDVLLHIVSIESGDSGVDVITDTLQQFSDVSAIHIISHGSDGTISLGSEILNLERLPQHEETFAQWQETLDDHADILIYGCDVAATDYGQQFIAAFANATGTDVAASDNTTGHSNLGGDWQLEATTGDIDTSTVVSTDTAFAWNHALTTFIVINTDNSGTGSLRWAIDNANLNAGVTDVISFNISGTGPHTISLSTALPTIIDPVIIDGWTEPDYANDGVPVITIDGTAIPGIIDGLHLDIGSDNSQISGLSIVNFAGDVIEINSTNNWVYGNYIGVETDGITAAGGDNGILIGNTAIGNRIGTDDDGTNDVEERNIISGNGDGIFVDGDTAGVGNFISGNYIGLGADGVTEVGNSNTGITLNNGPDGNVIGGATSDLGNVISGNGAGGIYLAGETTDNNTIENNLIGTTADGTGPLGNNGDGIYINGGGDNTTITNNIVANSSVVGIEADGASDGTSILGNIIGTDATGTKNWGSGENGILLENGTTNTTIGSTNPGDGNIIANNGKTDGTFNAGILVENGNTIVSIRGNSIYNNEGPGIDLSADNFADDTDTNDAGDTDTGGNNKQNWAVLKSASINDTGVFSYLLDTTTLAAGFYTVDFYAGTSRDNGEVEGERYLGKVSGVADGNNALSGTLAGITLATGEYVTLITTIRFES